MLRETVRCGTGDTAFPHVPRCPHRPRPTKATIHTRRLRVVLKGGAVVLRSWSCLGVGDRVATQMSVKYQIHTSAAPLRQRATEGGFIGTGGGRGADDSRAPRGDLSARCFPAERNTLSLSAQRRHVRSVHISDDGSRSRPLLPRRRADRREAMVLLLARHAHGAGERLPW